MPRVRVKVYVSCPHCGTRYSGSEDEHHLEGCPWPLEKQRDYLRQRLVVNTCPVCTGDVYINTNDMHECERCHAQWVGIGGGFVIDPKPTETVMFRVHGELRPVVRFDELPTGDFPRRDQLAHVEGQLQEAKAAFKKGS